VQVADAAGNVGQASTALPVPPSIVVSITPDTSCGDVCQTLVLRFDGVGIAGAAISASLDGKPIANGALIDTFTLAAGTHRIVVVVSGSTNLTKTLSFEVHATIEGLICAVQRAVREGLISRDLEQPLLAKLSAAKAARERGDWTSQTNVLKAFVNDLQAQRWKKIDAVFADRAKGWVLDLIARCPNSGR
jgi:cytochrome c